AHRDDLPELQRMLTEAQLEPDPGRSLVLFDAAVRRYPRSGDALLLLANELFHRGPLAGVPLDSGIAAYEASTRVQPYATAFMHAALGHIRLGQREAAARDLAARPPGPSADPEARLRARLLRYAYDERFVPWRAGIERRLLGWRPDSAMLAGILDYARFGTFFDIPDAQRALGRVLVRSGRSPAMRASGHQAQGLALILLGRTAAAIAQLDSAADIIATPEAELQQAEWRGLLAALGVPAPESLLAAGRARLARLADGPLGARAAWALATAALSRGDTAEGRVWEGRLARAAGSDSAGRPLARLAAALDAAARGALDSALALSASLVSEERHGLGGDPFARAVLRLHRGSWLARRGDLAGAERTWLWTDAWDVEDWPRMETQAGEVDVALSAIVRVRRARLALARGQSAVACGYLRRVGELWARADPVYAPLRLEAARLAAGCPG